MKIFYCFGDSITLGVNDAASGGWVARLAGLAAQKGLPVPPDTFYNLGVRKHSSRQILERWEAEYKARALEGTQAHFLFCFGTVDMVAPSGRPMVAVGESAANAREILSKARDMGKTVLVSPPPVKDEEHCQRLEALCTAYSTICDSVGVPFLDVFHPLKDAGYVDDLADGIHPGAAGNAILASLLAEHRALQDWFCA